MLSIVQQSHTITTKPHYIKLNIHMFFISFTLQKRQSGYSNVWKEPCNFFLLLCRLKIITGGSGAIFLKGDPNGELVIQPLGGAAEESASSPSSSSSSSSILTGVLMVAEVKKVGGGGGRRRDDEKEELRISTLAPDDDDEEPI